MCQSVTLTARLSTNVDRIFYKSSLSRIQIQTRDLQSHSCSAVLLWDMWQASIFSLKFECLEYFGTLPRSTFGNSVAQGWLKGLPKIWADPENPINLVLLIFKIVGYLCDC